MKVCVDAAMTLGLLVLMAITSGAIPPVRGALGLHWGMLLGMVKKAGKTRLSGKPISLG